MIKDAARSIMKIKAIVCFFWAAIFLITAVRESSWDTKSALSIFILGVIFPIFFAFLYNEKFVDSLVSGKPASKKARLIFLFAPTPFIFFGGFFLLFRVL